MFTPSPATHGESHSCLTSEEVATRHHGVLPIHGTLVPDVRKIAVLRANAVGDFIVALPALEALHRTYPEAEIVLLAREWHASFLQGRPCPVDRVIVIPPCRGVSLGDDAADNGPGLATFFREMRQERFDLAIQMHGGGRHSNPFVAQIGARCTVGSRAPDAGPLDRWIPYTVWQHEVLRYLEIVSLVGAEAAFLEPQVRVTASDLEESLALVPPAPGHLVVLHPGATDPQRRWPPEHFAAVGDALAHAGASILVTGSAEERRLGDAVLAAMRTRGQNLCGSLTLGGLTGLLSRCRLAVSNDTGPLHLARAVGVRTVGLYSAFNLVTYGPLTRLRHRVAVSWRTSSRPCDDHPADETCPACTSLLSDISVDDVQTEALDLLGAEQLARSPS